VVQGFRQKEGIDYFETFSPTVKRKSITFLLAIAAQEDLDIHQLDFDTAFLNAKLKETIYVQVPQGYKGQLFGHKVLRLVRALYGLKQAPREWWLALDQFLNTLGYKARELDECLYMKIVDGKRIYLTLYVDDTLAFFHKSLESIWLADKEAIAAKYAIKDIGECKWILNMEVQRDRAMSTITLSQQAYVQKLMEEFKLAEANHCVDPFLTTDISVPPENQKAYPLNKQEHELYRSIVGSLLYIANITRVDISFITGTLARYQVEPMNYHLAAAKKVLRYLKGTSGYQLIFKSKKLDISEPKGNPYETYRPVNNNK
jgi:hypothetical protein